LCHKERGFGFRLEKRKRKKRKKKKKLWGVREWEIPRGIPSEKLP
jgi:hypothetical protein